MEDYFNETIQELTALLKAQDEQSSATRAQITYYNQQHQAFKLHRETAIQQFSDMKEAEQHVIAWKKVIKKLESRRPISPVVYLRVSCARPGKRPRVVGMIDETTQKKLAIPTDIQSKALTALGMRIDFSNAGSHGYTPRKSSAVTKETYTGIDIAGVNLPRETYKYTPSPKASRERKSRSKSRSKSKKRRDAKS